MKILRDFVLVEEPALEEKKSEAGLILKQEKPNFTSLVEHTVIGIGSEVKDIKEGDVVLYLPRSGVEMKKDNGTWRFLKEEEIIAVM